MCEAETCFGRTITHCNMILLCSESSPPLKLPSDMIQVNRSPPDAYSSTLKRCVRCVHPNGSGDNDVCQNEQRCLIRLRRKGLTCNRAHRRERWTPDGADCCATVALAR
jgi:hypothetical protein